MAPAHAYNICSLGSFLLAVYPPGAFPAEELHVCRAVGTYEYFLHVGIDEARDLNDVGTLPVQKILPLGSTV
ncbi:hypothetical protein F5Y14DRAFT_395198 [Nemania sp. NC0429]|nr:hypothetical protein F5Y14DRAFT_395198 [Nemania sp. NC0429]